MVGTFEQKRTSILAIACLVQALVVPGILEAQSGQGRNPGNRAVAAIPKEPGWKDLSYRGWEVMGVPGLISTYYDLDLDGKLDYMVIRKILRKAAAGSVDIDQAIAIAKREGMSVYFSNPIIYFTHGRPLFYCKGIDYRRNCRDIWVDVAEDGLNGNEELYTRSTPGIGVR